MSTLPHRATLGTLAHILHAAAAVGPGAWDRGDARGKDAVSESTLSNDLIALFALLRDRRVSYLLVGGVALLRYIDGRNTDDIDLILAVDDLKRVPEIVITPSPSADSDATTCNGQPRERAGVRVRPIEKQSDRVKSRFRNVRVDLLLTSNDVFNLAMQRFRTTHQFAEIEVPCATVEGLVLLKLYALPALYLQGDLQRAALYETDIVMLCQRHRPDIAPLVQRSWRTSLRASSMNCSASSTRSSNACSACSGARPEQAETTARTEGELRRSWSEDRAAFGALFALPNRIRALRAQAALEASATAYGGGRSHDQPNDAAIQNRIDSKTWPDGHNRKLALRLNTQWPAAESERSELIAGGARDPVLRFK
jgi:hypothetical protein